MTDLEMGDPFASTHTEERLGELRGIDVIVDDGPPVHSPTGERAFTQRQHRPPRQDRAEVSDDLPPPGDLVIVDRSAGLTFENEIEPCRFVEKALAVKTEDSLVPVSRATL